MSDLDRTRWDAKYLRGDHSSETPSVVLTNLRDFLPATGRMLDVAGGAGRHALWFAKRGFETTLVDISSVALKLAADRAAQGGVALQTQSLDLENEPLPQGPWDVVLTFHFLRRQLFSELPKVLSPCGRLIVIQPTMTNLQRHSKPPADFLLLDGELPGLVTNLSIVHYEEGWLAEGRHEAILIAERSPEP